MRDYLEELLEELEAEAEGDIAGELFVLAASPAGAVRGAADQTEPGEEQRDGAAKTADPAGQPAGTPEQEKKAKESQPGDGDAAQVASVRARLETAAARDSRAPSQIQTVTRRDETERERRSGQAGGLEKERELELPLTAQPQAGEGREGQRAGTLKDQLDQAQRAASYRALSMAGNVAEDGGGSLFTESTAAAPAVEARQVDRVFERDARRYDCGFTLF